MVIEDRRDAVVVKCVHKGRKSFLVDYSPELAKKDGHYTWITFGVYFSEDDANYVRDLIEKGKLNLLKLDTE